MRSGISCTQKSSWGSTPNAKETRASAHRRPPRILGTSGSPAPCAPQNRDAAVSVDSPRDDQIDTQSTGSHCPRVTPNSPHAEAHTRSRPNAEECPSALQPLPTVSTLATTPRVLPARSKGAGGARSGSPRQSAWALHSSVLEPDELSTRYGKCTLERQGLTKSSQACAIRWG